VAWIVAVRGQEGESQGYVRPSACDKIIDGANDTLIYFVSTGRSGSDGSGLGMESMGMPDRYGVIFGTLFILSTPKRGAQNSVKAVCVR